MSNYKDTLQLYDELKASGCTEAQARAQAQQLGLVGNVLSDIKTELYWMRLIGAAMIVSFLSNMLVVALK